MLGAAIAAVSIASSALAAHKGKPTSAHGYVIADFASTAPHLC